MTTRSSPLAALLVAAVLVTLSAIAWAGSAELTVSGTITSIDTVNGLLVVSEMGPWRVEKGEPVITRRTFMLTAATEFARVVRADSVAPTGFAGDFVEESAAADELRVGDFVTVEVERSGSRFIARRITVVELKES